MNLSEKGTIKKVIDGTSSGENARCVVEWFSSTIEGQQFLSDMIDRDAYLMEEEFPGQKRISPIQSEIILSRIDKEIRHKRYVRMARLTAAIVVPFVVLLGFGLYLNSLVDLFGKSHYAEIYIPKGESARIFFQDGSEAYLNADTKIRYPQKFGLTKRQVYVEGEAYFNVTPAKKRPFVVHAGNTSVKVLGTSFNIKAYSDEKKIQVVLDEGEIEFHTPFNSYTVLPGQQIIFDKIRGESVIRNLPTSTNFSLWKSNILYFQDTPLAEVLRILERRYDVSFQIKDEKALRYSYTIITHQMAIADILAELEKISPVKFTFQKDAILVSLHRH